MVSSALGFIYWRFLQSVPRGSLIRPLLAGGLVIGGLLILSAPFFTRILGVSETGNGGSSMLPHSLLSASVWLGFTLMGFGLILFFTLGTGDLFRLMVSPGLDPQRRDFLIRWIPWASLGTATALAWRGYQTAISSPVVKQVPLSVANLPADLHNLKIVQISDLHVGHLLRRPHVERVVEMTMNLQPDLIFLTGDLVDGTPEYLERDFEPLRQLKARYGVFAVTGNHEYYWQAESWIKVFKETGFDVLLNEHRRISIGKSQLLVAGITDLQGGRFYENHAPNVEQALKGSEPSDFSILLAHQPNSYKLAQGHPIDLQMSGHTHSGQFYPAAFLIRFFQRYYRGLYRHDERLWIYVNQGTGFWGPPNRLGLPSEITLLELNSKTV